MAISFATVFADANERWVGKQHTQAIEGNHCAIRHRISRAVRKNCCFSKLLFYHIKVFNIGFAYINACHWRKRRKNRRGCIRLALNITPNSQNF